MRGSMNKQARLDIRLADERNRKHQNAVKWCRSLFLICWLVVGLFTAVLIYSWINTN